MGYRSDVAIAMYAVEEKDAPAIKLWLKENFPQEGWDDNAIRWFNRGMIFQANNIKWYEYDDEVIKAVMRSLDEFENLFSDEQDTPEGAYDYIRIGEDDDDVDQRHIGNAEYLVSLQRSIYIEA